MTFYHVRNVVVTTGYSLLFVGPFIITDELLRVTAVFGFLLKAGLFPGVTLFAANLVLGGCFGWLFSKHSSHRLGYFLMYTLTLPLSCVLGLFALLLNEANGNIFFVEYFMRLCLNVVVFFMSCTGGGVERPQQDIFTGLLWINVISFSCIMATLSNKILRNSGVHWNVISVHEIDPSSGSLYLEGMAPMVSLESIPVDPLPCIELEEIQHRRLSESFTESLPPEPLPCIELVEIRNKQES